MYTIDHSKDKQRVEQASTLSNIKLKGSICTSKCVFEAKLHCTINFRKQHPPPHPTPSNIKELWPLINPESSDLPKETSPSQPLSENSETKVKWYIYFPINSQVKVRDLDFRQSTTSVFLGLYYRRVQLSIYHFIQHVGLKSLFIKRLQNFIQLNYSSCLKEMFTVRSPSYNLRDNVRSALFPYVASKIWNSLSDTYKNQIFYNSSKRS